MQYYFSDSSVKYEHEVFKSKYCKNRLFSYAYKNTIKRLFGIYADLYMKDLVNLSEVSLIIDSGAYSVWNSKGKKPIVIDEYIKFCDDIENMFAGLFKKIEYVNLDVIPGERDRKPTKSEILEAQETSWENYLYISERLPNTLAVFHQGDEWQYLDYIEERTTRYCVSPANDRSTQSKLTWLNEVFGKIDDNAKPHGLGFSAASVSRQNSWYSFDAATHALRAAFGTVVYFNGHDMMDIVFSDVRGPAETGTHFLKLPVMEQMKLKDEFKLIDPMFTYTSLTESGQMRHLINCYYMSKYYEKYNYNHQAIQTSLF